jgi:hypothetical protein
MSIGTPSTGNIQLDTQITTLVHLWRSYCWRAADAVREKAGHADRTGGDPAYAYEVMRLAAGMFDAAVLRGHP